MNKINYQDASLQTHKNRSLQKNRQYERAITNDLNYNLICNRNQGVAAEREFNCKVAVKQK